MTPEEAAWVREHVWTTAHRAIDAAYPHGFYGRCACQGGICGACDGTSDRGRPRHDRCLSRQHGHPVVSALTYLADQRCMVIGPALWPATGPSCRYICPCPCAKTGLFPPPPPARRTTVAAKPKPARARTASAANTTPKDDSGQLGLDLEVST